MTEGTTSERVELSGRDRDRTVLAVTGMTCGSCANAVSRALSRVPGVVRAEVDLGAGRATVEGSARPEELLAAVEKAGFDASLAQGPAAEATARKGGCGCC